VRLKLSNKDLIVIAGIVVAAIIVITTVAMDSPLPQRKGNAELPSLIKLSKPLVILKKISLTLFENYPSW